MKIEYGRKDDLEWLGKHDEHANDEWVRRCLDHSEYLVATNEDGDRVGYVRFSFFWAVFLILTLFMSQSRHRRLGVGRALIEFWEQEMKRHGAQVVMSSVVVHNLEAHDWHEHNGYSRCGQLVLGKRESEPECFIVRFWRKTAF